MSLIGHNLTRAKQLNKSLVFQTLLLNGPLSRQNIAEMTKLTPATITNLTAELIAQGWIEEIGNIQADQIRSGRKSIALSINGDNYKTLGVHLRSDRLELGIVNLTGKVSNFEMLPYGEISPYTFIDFLSDTIQSYLARHSQVPISSIGIGSVGLVHHEQGIIISAEHMGWKDIHVAEPLTSRLKIPVLLDNNVRTMALAEKMFGKNKLISDSLFVYVGKGIGAGLVLNNQIYRGGVTGAGEFGHITLHPDGISCWCGNKGCLERYASEAALLESLGFTQTDEIVSAIKAGDQRVEEAVIQAARMIAVGLASFNNVFHIQKVILAGALTNEHLPFISTIRKQLAERSFLTQFEAVDVENSVLGQTIGVVGAASLSIYGQILEKDVQVGAQTIYNQ